MSVTSDLVHSDNLKSQTFNLNANRKICILFLGRGIFYHVIITNVIFTKEPTFHKSVNV